MTAAPLLAVDGGNSKTDVALLRADGTLLAAARGPGSNPHTLGLRGALDVVERAIDAAWSDAGISTAGGPRPIASVGAFFMAGADQPAEERALADAIARRDWTDQQLVDNDTFALLWAGSARGWGVAVVVGAGVNGVGRSPSGATARFPALGEITGDWGGGPAIGLAGLGAAVRAEDGRGPDTSLRTAIALHFGEISSLDVALAVREGRIDLDRIGELSALVLAAAGHGDSEAATIVDRQADEIVRFAAAALRRLDLIGEATEVVLGGSVVTSSPPRLIDRVRECLAAIAPRADVVLCRSRPLVGAAVAALDTASAGPAAAERLRAQLSEDRIRDVGAVSGGGASP